MKIVLDKTKLEQQVVSRVKLLGQPTDPMMLGKLTDMIHKVAQIHVTGYPCNKEASNIHQAMFEDAKRTGDYGLLLLHDYALIGRAVVAGLIDELYDELKTQPTAEQVTMSQVQVQVQGQV